MGPGPITDKYRKEVALLAPFLPSRLSEDDTRALVSPLAAQAKGLGQFMGLVMKQFKGQVDPEVVKKIGAELGLK